MNKNKLILPISIILGTVILGGFYYANQQQWVIEQNSKCKQETKSLAKEEEKQDAVFMVNVLEATYSKEKGRCISAIKLILGKRKKYQFQLVDPESAEKIAIYWYDYSSKEIYGDWDIYKEIYTNVFNSSPTKGRNLE